MKRKIVAAAACVMAAVGVSAFAQDRPIPVPEAAVPAPAAVAAPAPTSITLREGTELRVSFEQKLSSATANSGDLFNIALADDITVDGVKIKPGYSGRGEVTAAEKKGMMGKAGTLNVRLDYIRIGDERVRLRASKGDEGKSSVGATVALTVLFGPLGLIKHGHDLEIPRGQTMVAFVDQDTKISLPLAPPPMND
jgi:hypothetical protein